MSTESLSSTPVSIPVGDGARIEADLTMPRSAHGLVVFAHGSGSSRFSPRNQQVAFQLQARGLATLLADLLTPAEDRADQRTRRWRFDIPLLGRRVTAVVDWAASQSPAGDLRIGLFGASTGAAAALLAAAERPDLVGAVVSRGGRPDLAGDDLPRVHAPTLLLVGEHDEPVIELNREAMDRMTSCAVRLEIVPGATHLFEEFGTLEQVARRAGDWFDFHLSNTTH
jgi:dienelactone hydrolase